MVIIDPGRWEEEIESPSASDFPQEREAWVGKKITCQTHRCGAVFRLVESDLVYAPIRSRDAQTVTCSVLCPFCELVTVFEVTRSEPTGS